MRDKSVFVNGVIAVVLVALSATAGCHTSGRHGLSMDRVGSTQLAVLSVTDWEDYRVALSPQYDLSSKEALAIASQDARSVESSVLDAFRAKLNLRLAPNEVLLPGFGTPTPPAGAVQGTPASEPGVTAAGASVAPPPRDGASPRLSGSEAIPDPKALGGDPFLRYMAATALFQEVKLLERYVQDAVQKKGYQASIVRLQLTNQPFSDRYAYDSYANIAFFADPVAIEPASGGLRGRSPFDMFMSDLELLMRDIHESEVPEKIGEKHQFPVVIPLLVTDQVESALVSGRLDEVRQLAFGLSAAFAGIGGDVNLEKIDQAIEKVAGRSYRSLFTVGRLADNMLRVRMAARAKPDAKKKGKGFNYETIARTQNVTVLLLVPRKTGADQKVYVATRYEYRWPDTGDRIGVDRTVQGTNSAVAQRAKALVNSGGYGISNISEQNALSLAILAQGNSLTEFIKTFRTIENPATPDAIAKAEAQARRLYMDLNVAKLGSNFDSTQFDVPIKPMVTPDFGSSMAYAVDNGKTTEITLDGVRGLDASKVSGTWNFRVPSDTDSSRSLAATGVKLNGRAQLVLTFPSLLGLEIIPKGGSLLSNGLLYLTHADGLGSTPTVGSFLAKGPPAKAPALTIFPSKSLTVVAPNGVGTLDLGFQLENLDVPAATTPVATRDEAKSTFVVVFSNPSVKVAGIGAGGNTPNPILRPIDGMPGAFVVMKSGSATFNMLNLVAGTKVAVAFAPPEGGLPVEKLEITVNAPPKDQ